MFPKVVEKKWDHFSCPTPSDLFKRLDPDERGRPNFLINNPYYFKEDTQLEEPQDQPLPIKVAVG
jgi:hypothetical protein